MQMKTTLEATNGPLTIDVTPYAVREGHYVRLSLRGANGLETHTLLHDEHRHAIIAFLSLVPDTPKD